MVRFRFQHTTTGERREREAQQQRQRQGSRPDQASRHDQPSRHGQGDIEQRQRRPQGERRRRQRPEPFFRCAHPGATRAEMEEGNSIPSPRSDPRFDPRLGNCGGTRPGLHATPSCCG